MNSGNTLKKNVVANFVGNFLGAIISFIFIPIYIRYIGTEAYGLIGFYTAISGFIQIMDFGISGTLNISISKIRNNDDEKIFSLNLFRSFEIINISIAVLIFLFFFLLSDFFAQSWFKDTTLQINEIRNSIMLMGMVIAFKWPTSLYIAAFNGLEKQVKTNYFILLYTVFSVVGAILALHFFKPTIQVFFQWQLLVTIIYCILLKYTISKELKRFKYIGRFDVASLKIIKNFTISLGFISLFSSTYSHLDKIFISKLISLEEFSFYSIAATLAAILYKFIYPVSGAVFPKINQIIHIGNKEVIHDFFHKSAQIISALVIPIGLTLCFFSNDLIFLWSQNLVLAQNVAPITSIIVIGTIITGINSTPQQYQLAYGYTKILFYQNLAGTILLLPLLYTLVKQYGVIGAAMVWVIINIINLTIGQYFFFSRFLKSEAKSWVFQDILKPIVVSILILGLSKYIMGVIENNILKYILIGFASFSSILIAILVMNHTRDMFFSIMNKYLLKNNNGTN